MKWLTRLLGRKTENRVYGAKSQCGVILQALVEGEVMGGKEACKLVGHNGLRRLNQVRARLRARGILLHTSYERARSGKQYKLSYLPTCEREDARRLMEAL